MKRENIALLARARHDAEARREVGRRYLTGADGFPRHEQQALEYLTHPSLSGEAEAARIICEHLDLARIVEVGHELTLQRAASEGSAEAQFKWGAWVGFVGPDIATALRWLSRAAQQGHLQAQNVERSMAIAKPSDPQERLLEALRIHWHGRIEPLAMVAAGRVAQQRDFARLATCLRIVIEGHPEGLLPIARHLQTALRHQIEFGGAVALQGVSVQQIEACLEALAADGDAEAVYWLGCAYAGFGLPPLVSTQLVEAPNLRKGVALLMRAADAGSALAWMHLYRTHANHRCSVANPQLARYFLEKAATAGIAEAQRRLGALLLRASATLKDTELAVHWLHRAASAGDPSAGPLLRTLVLRAAGSDGEADEAIALVRSSDPWLAARLQLARDFGLTKLEALSVDPVEGRRPWGLVVGRNPFVALSKLSSPRAIPALDAKVLDNLQRTVLLFDAARRDGSVVESDFRRRSARQRRLFQRLGISESLFFTSANSTTLEALRKGHKWVLRAKQAFERALAAGPHHELEIAGES